MGRLATEIKLNVGAAQIPLACEVFGLTADAAKDRRIWFGEIIDGADGPEALPLSARGVIIRARAKPSGKGDVTVKLRGPDGGIDVAAWVARTAEFGDAAKIEGDWAARRLVSASLTDDLDASARAALDGPGPGAADLLTGRQRALAGELLVPWEHVRMLGPIAARKWDAEHDGDVAAELWTLDATLRFLEISVVAVDDPAATQRALEERARAGGLVLDGPQETKTAVVLRELVRRHGSV